DGNLETTLTLSGNPTPRSDSIQHAALATAMDSTGTAAGFFNGVLDEARVWNFARTQAEIDATKDIEVLSASGLIGRWGMNEGSGTSVADSSGSGINGTAMNGPVWVPGFPSSSSGTPTPTPTATPTPTPTGTPGSAGTALDFDGSNDYVTFGPAAGLGTATFTVETWFKREGAGVGTSTGTGGIPDAIPLVTKGRAEAEGSNVDMNYFLGIRASDGVLVADFEEGAGQPTPGLNHPVIGATVVTSNVWHHAAVTYDGTTWRLFLDGNQDATLAVGRSPRSDSIQHAALATAMDSTGTAAGFFNGVLDEARVWNFARTQAEIDATKDIEVLSASGLIGRWGMNEGSGTSVADSSGSGINGTAMNGPVWVPGFPSSSSGTPTPTPTATPTPTPTGTPGSAGTALDFDGSNDYVTFGPAAGLGTATFTVETWFKREGAGVGTSTGSGGIADAIPLVTKGRAETDGSNVDMNYFLGIRLSDGVLVGDFEDTATGANHPVAGVTSIAIGTTWHHAAATYDGSTWQLYLDGNLETTLTLSGNPTPRFDSIQH